jgi:hypothetical protein
MTRSITKAYSDRAKFMDKHGFSFKKPSQFKDCLVIRFPHRKINTSGGRNSLGFDYQRAREISRLWCNLTRNFSKPADFVDNMSYGPDLGLPYLGVYTSRTGIKSFIPLWAIPNEYEKVQNFILENLPEWAKVTKK